jgi:hypothetical protein
MQNLTVQKVCLALIALAFFVAAPWITSETIQGNSLPLTILAGVAVFLFFIYGLGDRCWLIIPFCLSIEGNLNFLPLNFSMQELAIMTVFGYLLFRMIFGLDVPWKLGPALIWVPMAGVLAVLLYHWIGSRDIGIKLLGGTGWGGRSYFKVALAALSVPLLASFPKMRMQDLQLVPLVYFLGSFVDIVPDLLTTFIPATAPYVWRFYSGVNLAEYGAVLQGNFIGEKGITRFGTLAKLGTSLGLVTLCYFPANTWLHPNRLWALPVVLLAGIFCALSGFRNTIFRYGLCVLAGLYAPLRLKSFAMFPLVAVFALGVAFTQGRFFEYPLQIQRALAFLPGEWKFQATYETENSSKWRKKIDELFYKEYFHQAPLIGKGYHFDPELAKKDTDIYLAITARQAEAGDEYADVRRYIEQRMPHEGPVHILLVTGMVGMVFFVGFSAALLIYSFSSVQKTPSNEVTPIQIWAASLILANVSAFFVVFGEYQTFFIVISPIVTLLYRFERLKKGIQPAFQPDSERESPSSSAEFTWHGSTSSWHPRQPPAS